QRARRIGRGHGARRRVHARRLRRAPRSHVLGRRGAAVLRRERVRRVGRTLARRAVRDRYARGTDPARVRPPARRDRSRRVPRAGDAPRRLDDLSRAVRPRGDLPRRQAFPADERRLQPRLRQPPLLHVHRSGSELLGPVAMPHLPASGSCPLRRAAAAFLPILAAAVLLPAAARAQSPEYVIGPRDVLAVTVANEPSLSGRFTVVADGTLSFPLLGTLKVGGLSPAAVERELTERLA